MTALAVDLDQRASLLPNGPTLRELGYKGPLTPSFFGVVAPKGTPRLVIDKLRETIVQIASDKEFIEKNMTNLGLIPIFNTPNEFAIYLTQTRAEAERIVSESKLELR
jgi:tripartite-type tricarboxylate transporter receptor subunit TctC